MYQRVLQQMLDWQVPMAEWAALGAVLLVIVLIAWVSYWVLHRIVLRFLDSAAQKSQRIWHRALFGRKLFSRSMVVVQLVILSWQIQLWLPDGFVLLPVSSIILESLIVLYVMLSLFSLLDVVLDFSMTSRAGRELPLRGLFQGVKLALAVMALLLIVSILIGQSPLILLSGLGAMTAILLLVFKDPILGLVAGIQLSANRMVAPGDWVEMPQYKANGEVIDITLTTVKVQNWDKTITTIPTYAMISDAFVNWQGMQKTGARRIKRSVTIDVRSVRFVDDELKQRIANLPGVADYLAASKAPTNLGAVRFYIAEKLRQNEKVRSDLTLMVRQLQQTAQGIPLEIYCFSAITDWIIYEGIQADIFDELYASLDHFDLAIYQSPSGTDFQQLMSS
ncbi:mechanosensitive ion channel family protein [Salinibius halmophilus]|uniref:mechanosensitive ion channel family protein n=1 Tax=Salinibius halmophilus TaxID=1853216 RepID=UPI0018F5B450|nr:mechanosensitive ion channel family protein [Salinibius halmophilus]